MSQAKTKGAQEKPSSGARVVLILIVIPYLFLALTWLSFSLLGVFAETIVLAVSKPVLEMTAPDIDKDGEYFREQLRGNNSRQMAIQEFEKQVLLGLSWAEYFQTDLGTTLSWTMRLRGFSALFLFAGLIGALFRWRWSKRIIVASLLIIIALAATESFVLARDLDALLDEVGREQAAVYRELVQLYRLEEVGSFQNPFTQLQGMEEGSRRTRAFIYFLVLSVPAQFLALLLASPILDQGLLARKKTRPKARPKTAAKASSEAETQKTSVPPPLPKSEDQKIDPESDNDLN